MRRAWWVLVLLLPTVQAGFSIPDQTIRDQFEYQGGLSATEITILSGKLDLEAEAKDGTFGFFNATSDSLGIGGAAVGARFNNIKQACWAPNAMGCVQGNNIQVLVSHGGAFGFRFPGVSITELRSSHVLGLFVDFREEKDLEALKLGRALVGATVDSELEIGLPTQPVTQIPDGNTAGALVVLDDTTQLVVYSDGQVVHTARRAGDPVLIQGPSIGLEPFAAETLVIPTAQKVTSTWTPASKAVASESLSLDRIQNAMAKINGQSGTKTANIGPLEPVVSSLLNGAYMSVPADNATAKNLSLVRFNSLEVTGSGSTLNAAGKGALVIQSGSVKGAQPLIGSGWVQFPWWTLLLWGLAIAAFVTRLVLKDKAPKTHEKWDRLQWVGRVANGAVLVLIFLLWDFEVRGVLGTSLLGFPQGTALVAVLMLQLGFLFGMGLVAQWPLKVLFGNGARIAKQGKLMGLTAPLAMLLGYFLAAPLLLSYLNLALQQAP